ncbi:unnamed protein product [Calypogeia fissa]
MGKRRRVQAVEVGPVEPPTNVAEVYLQIMDEVIHKVMENLRDDFLLEDGDERALINVRECWESNLIKSGAVIATGTTTEQQSVAAMRTVGTASTQIVDLNLPWEEMYQYQPHQMNSLYFPEPQTITTTRLTGVTPKVDVITLPMQTPPVYLRRGEPNMFPCNPRGPTESFDGTSGLDKHGRERAPSMYHNGRGINIDLNSSQGKGQEEGECEQGPVSKKFATQIAMQKRKFKDQNTCPSWSSNHVPTAVCSQDDGVHPFKQSGEVSSVPTLSRHDDDYHYNYTGILQEDYNTIGVGTLSTGSN